MSEEKPIAEVIRKQELGKKVTEYLVNLLDKLISEGVSKEEAEKAIAGKLPYCISRYAQS